MDLDTEVDRQGNEEEKKYMRPPSSYCSMRSESVDLEEEDEEGHEEEIAKSSSAQLPVVLPDPSEHERTGLHMIRSESPETLLSTTTYLTKPPGAVVVETSSHDMEDLSEHDEEDMDEYLEVNSPEPPEPVEPDDTLQTDTNSQPGRLHPEQDMPHVFKSIQHILTDLTMEEMLQFKTWFTQWETELTLQQAMEGDLLDFVDKMMEVFGLDRSLVHTINTLEAIKKQPKADELKIQCKRALIRCYLKQHLIRKYQVIREGVPRPGRHNLLNTVYVEPQISTCGHGGVNSSHEIRPLASPPQVPSADTFVGINSLFRLEKNNGQPVRTVLTTGIPGIGMSVSVAKFCLDWAEHCANMDLQFVITLPFSNLWSLRSNNADSHKMSVSELIEYFHPKCKDMEYLEEDGCKFLIVMDSFDCYQTPLDWENAPELNDNSTQAHLDILIVNIVRGSLLRGARVWVLGRRAAVSQIPPRFIDAVTEIQGFSDEMKDDYFMKRFSDPELATKIVTHYKCLPTLRILTHQPFVCWIVARVFETYFRYAGYGVHPPRLTPFYVNTIIVQTNRKLEFYEQTGHTQTWSVYHQEVLTKMGKMAFHMLQRNTSVFFEEDVKEHGLELTEVTVCSGLCTELPAAASDGKRVFCFIHFTFQEFMAALYVFTMFRSESKNVLVTGGWHMPSIFSSKDQSKLAANLVHCAVERTLSSPLGHYDMFLRFLCGLLSPSCHDKLLSGYLYSRRAPKVSGLDGVRRLLEHKIETAQQNNRDRVENLQECLREMTQEDD